MTSQLIDPTLKNKVNTYLCDSNNPDHLRKVTNDLWNILISYNCEDLFSILLIGEEERESNK